MSSKGTLVVDGRECSFEAGQSVVQAARENGIWIPSLCQDDRLEPGGHCRLCLVEIEGQARPVASCTVPAREGLNVRASSEQLSRLRGTLLEMVLSENPEGDCPRCRDHGACELHSVAERLGVNRGRFLGAISGAQKSDGNPFLGRDYSQCIGCYRCTRICDEVQGDAAIAPAGRGFLSRIATAFDGELMDSSCSLCGQCIHTCPTGALFDRKMVGAEQAAQASTSAVSTCPYCGTGCSIHLHVRDNELLGVSPNLDGPANQGALCVKGQFGFDFVNNEERLSTPLIRENGSLREASWDEALDLTAARLSAVKKQHGGDAFYAIASGRAPNESAYMLQKFARAVMSTHQIDNCSRG